MAHRLTNTEKWQDAWFSELSPNGKLLFMFLYENCDNAGIYEINKKFMLFLLGLNEDELKTAIGELNKSYVKSKDGKRVWLKNFLKHQKKLPLNHKNSAHKQIIVLLEENIADVDKFKGIKEMANLIPIDPEKPKKTRNNPQRTTPSTKFTKPSVQEVQEYMKEKEFKLAEKEGERFWHWFESNGWKVGRNPMKSWKGAVTSWLHNWYDRNKVSRPSKISNVKEASENLAGMDWNKVYGEPENA